MSRLPARYTAREIATGITAGLMVDTRALLDAARKETRT